LLYTVCETSGYLLSYWNRPFFPEWCSHSTFDDAATYDTMVRIAGSYLGFALMDRTSDSPGRSGRSPSTTTGRTSCSCQTTTLRRRAGSEPGRSMPSSAATTATRSRGCDSVSIRRTNNSTIFCDRYDHSREVLRRSLADISLYSSRDTDT